MKIANFMYSKSQGWSVKEFPKLDSENTLVIVFAAPEFINDPSPIEFLAAQYPRSMMIGCSSAGEVIGTSINDMSLSVAVAKFEHTELMSAECDISEASESYEVGKAVSNSLDRKDLKGIFVLSEGLCVNGSELVRGLNSLDDKNITVTGGLAADGSRFKETWAINKGKIRKNLVVAVGFYGDRIKIGHGSQGGWDRFGPERRITKSVDNILYELDDKPALSLYKEYLGERASGLPATGLLFPLSIRIDKDDDKRLVRTILAVNESEESLTFAGNVPVGHLAQLMYANFDRLIAGAIQAGESAVDKLIPSDKESPLLVVAISCVGRRLLLGNKTEEEVESIADIMPKQAKIIGFYSYGELSPYASGKCDFHNQTMTLTIFSETE